MADVGAELIALLLVASALATVAYGAWGWVGVAGTLAVFAAGVLAVAVWLAVARA